MLHGSCLCGAVRYEIDGPLRGALNCHCSMCRKAHGAAFRSRAAVRSEHFRFTAGEGLVTDHESSPGTFRGFCSRCGSPLRSRFTDHPDWLGLPLGTLDDDPGVRPAMHVHVASRAPWFDITDDLPQHPGAPPAPATSAQDRPQPASGANEHTHDNDLRALSRDQLAAEVRRLRQAIREHRDAVGHDLCWHQPDLWSLLPEKVAPRLLVPEWPQFMRGCIRYRQSLDEQAPEAPRSRAEFAPKEAAPDPRDTRPE